MKNLLIESDSLLALQNIDNKTFDLIYVDPPFGTQTFQTMNRKRDGEVISSNLYSDHQDDYMEFITPYLLQFKRLLKDNATLYVHLDYRWVHYVKIELDKIFGRESFLNEIIWSYNFGGRGKKCWPKKHDTILMYVNDPNKYIFNYDDIDRIPYVAPEMQYVGRTKEEAEIRIAKGQIPTDVWNMSIVGTNSKERVGYPNQKPVELLKRIIKTSSPINGNVLDCFCGSGTTGMAAALCNRNYTLIDTNPESIKITSKRLKEINSEFQIISN